MHILIILTSIICITGIAAIIFIVKLKSILDSISKNIPETNKQLATFRRAMKNDELFRQNIESEIALIKKDTDNLFSQLYKLQNSKTTDSGTDEILKHHFEKGNKHSDSGVSLFNENMKTIMIAEDTEYNYLLLEAILKDNFKITRAKNGIEAVEMHKTDNPDIILMDIKMPDMDGLEATEIIRKTDKDTPIIAVTAYAFDGDIERAINLGCSDYLTKPVNAKKLRHTLSKYLA